MKFILYMAITANGYIATLNDETPKLNENTIQLHYQVLKEE